MTQEMTPKQCRQEVEKHIQRVRWEGKLDFNMFVGHLHGILHWASESIANESKVISQIDDTYRVDGDVTYRQFLQRLNYLRDNYPTEYSRAIFKMLAEIESDAYDSLIEDSELNLEQENNDNINY